MFSAALSHSTQQPRWNISKEIGPHPLADALSSVRLAVLTSIPKLDDGKRQSLNLTRTYADERWHRFVHADHDISVSVRPRQSASIRVPKAFSLSPTSEFRFNSMFAGKTVDDCEQRKFNLIIPKTPRIPWNLNPRNSWNSWRFSKPDINRRLLLQILIRYLECFS